MTVRVRALTHARAPFLPLASPSCRARAHAQAAYLFKYDSTHGRFPGTVECDEANNILIVNGKKIKFYAAKSPNEVPWGEAGAHIGTRRRRALHGAPLAAALRRARLCAAHLFSHAAIGAAPAAAGLTRTSTIDHPCPHARRRRAAPRPRLRAQCASRRASSPSSTRPPRTSRAARRR